MRGLFKVSTTRLTSVADCAYAGTATCQPGTSVRSDASSCHPISPVWCGAASRAGAAMARHEASRASRRRPWAAGRAGARPTSWPRQRPAPNPCNANRRCEIMRLYNNSEGGARRRLGGGPTGARRAGGGAGARPGSPRAGSPRRGRGGGSPGRYPRRRSCHVGSAARPAAAGTARPHRPRECAGGPASGHARPPRGAGRPAGSGRRAGC